MWGRPNAVETLTIDVSKSTSKKEEEIFDPVDEKCDCCPKCQQESQQASLPFMHDKLWNKICSEWGQIQVETRHDLLHAADV